MDPTAPLHTILVPGGAPFDEFPFNTVPVRSLRPPPFCAADAEVEARGFGVAPTGHVTAQFTLADVTSGSYFAEDFMLVAARAPAAFVQGDSGGGVAVAGLGLVGVISGGEPVSGVVPVTRAAPVGAVSNREWIWSVLDASGSCALGSLGPCVLREPAPSTGTICGDGHCTGTEAPSTCPTDCDIWAEEAPFHDTDGDGLPDTRDLCCFASLSAGGSI